MASLSCPAADEVLSGVDALSVPLFDEEFALGPPMRLVRSDRVRLFSAGIRTPGGEVPDPDGGAGSAEEPDVLRVCGTCVRTPSSHLPQRHFSVFLAIGACSFACLVLALPEKRSTHEASWVYRFWGRLDFRRSPVLGTRSSEPMHTIRANLYWEFQFVLGYIAVPRGRIRPGNPLRVGRG